MNDRAKTHNQEPEPMSAVRVLAKQAFARTAGAPLIGGNHVRLLKDARENYPAWLEAIGTAKRYIHFESYIIYDDAVGREFADAILLKASQGVQVRLIYDWLGGLCKTRRSFWNRLRGGGVEVRCYNPPRFDSPLGWLSRDHRKMLAVDGKVAFISGLCIGRMWAGIPEKKVEPWRDTGVEIRGPAVADIERAFAEIWALIGAPLPEDEVPNTDPPESEGNINLRIVATVPAIAGILRLDLLVAALARKSLWLTDPYYAGISSYVQALEAAAKDGVDVRLLVPNGTDIPLLRPLSRAGYRPLLEAGVRVFEWNGTMLHAKTAVADGRWARIGSTNLNLASWIGNCELDAVVEDEMFAHSVEEMYLQDLTSATELVLDTKRKLRAPGEPRHHNSAMTSGGGSGGRAAAGALRIGNAIGAAFTDRRVLELVEARIMMTFGSLLLLLAVLFMFFPMALVLPVIIIFIWVATAFMVRSYRLLRLQRKQRNMKDEE